VIPRATFCFDTSAFIQCWTRYYPLDVFPGMWEKLDTIATQNVIVCPEEVRYEIEKKEDGLHEWVKGRAYLFAPLDEPVQQAARAILARYPLLVKATAQRTQADPFVIALAQVNNIPVVSEERGGTAKRPKIPYVCDELKIPCMTVVEFIRSQGWQFT
jgi:hypothetical protein